MLIYLKGGDTLLLTEDIFEAQDYIVNGTYSTNILPFKSKNEAKNYYNNLKRLTNSNLSSYKIEERLDNLADELLEKGATPFGVINMHNIDDLNKWMSKKS